jgi:hypothetical protein
MLLRELILEGAVSIFGRSGNKTVRKYRCTSGARKGRIVAKAATCTAPRNVAASRTLTKTKRAKSSPIKVKSSRTKKANPYSRRLKNVNTGLRTRRKKSKGKRI